VTGILIAVSGVHRYSLRAVGDYIKQTVRETGVRGPWRGNSATVLRVAPYAATNFAAHEQWKHVLYSAEFHAQDDQSRLDYQLINLFVTTTAASLSCV